MKKTLVFVLILLVLIQISQASALFVSSADLQNILYPGEESKIKIVLYNDFDYKINEVSFVLDLTNMPFTTIGSSEKSINEIDDDDSETISFIIVASTNAKPGDYNLPYTLNFEDLTFAKKGTIGIKISGKTDLEFTSLVENPIVGEKGKLSLKIINTGSGEARFVKMNIIPDGYTLISERDIYIGTISSDDFETADFDVIFDSEQVNLDAQIEYVDLENQKSTKLVSLPIQIYSKEKALELGLIKKSTTGVYVIIIIFILLIWFIWRKIKKRKKQLTNQRS